MGKVLVVEFKENDSPVFSEIMAVLQKHEDLEKYEIKGDAILSVSGLEIYPQTRKVYNGQQELQFTAKEYSLLCLLIVNKNRVLTYNQIYENVWGDFSSGNERDIIGFHIRNLRKKLYSAIPAPPIIIESIRKVGYQLKISNNT